MNTLNTHELLEKSFDRVCNPDDWRAPIDWIGEMSCDTIEITAAAISHFTGTMMEWKELPDGKVHITAVGYRMGPAGP